MPDLGAYRLGDGAPVSAESATAMWAAVTREVLEDTSRRGGAITHSDLGRQVQQRSGIQTRRPTAEWLLPVVAQATASDPELAGVLRPDPSPAVAGRAKRAGTRTPRAPRQPAAPKREAPPPPVCPTCFMQLPATGRCDTCG
jgi:hypothetical protein